MGRGNSGIGKGSGGSGSPYGKLLKTVTDAPDYRSFFNANKGNPDFMQFGREYGSGAARDLWLAKRAETEKKDLHEISKEDAINTIRAAIPDNARDGWFRQANSDYKPTVAEGLLSTKGGLNAAYNIAYNNYKAETKNPLPFKKWLTTPQTMYRGDRGQQAVQSDLFTSYTPSKKVAQSFGSNITTKKIRPIDTWGSAQTTGEQEFLIPTPKTKKKK